MQLEASSSAYSVPKIIKIGSRMYKFFMIKGVTFSETQCRLGSWFLTCLVSTNQANINSIADSRQTIIHIYYLKTQQLNDCTTTPALKKTILL